MTVAVGDVLKCLFLQWFQILKLNYVVKFFECYVLDYQFGYRFDNVVF